MGSYVCRRARLVFNVEYTILSPIPSSQQLLKGKNVPLLVKGIRNPMVSIKRCSNWCAKSAVVQSGWTFLWTMRPSKCNEQ